MCQECPVTKKVGRYQCAMRRRRSCTWETPRAAVAVAAAVVGPLVVHGKCAITFETGIRCYPETKHKIDTAMLKNRVIPCVFFSWWNLRTVVRFISISGRRGKGKKAKHICAHLDAHPFQSATSQNTEREQSDDLLEVLSTTSPPSHAGMPSCVRHRSRGSQKQEGQPLTGRRLATLYTMIRGREARTLERISRYQNNSRAIPSRRPYSTTCWITLVKDHTKFQ